MSPFFRKSETSDIALNKDYKKKNKDELRTIIAQLESEKQNVQASLDSIFEDAARNTVNFASPHLNNFWSEYKTKIPGMNTVQKLNCLSSYINILQLSLYNHIETENSRKEFEQNDKGLGNLQEVNDREENNNHAHNRTGDKHEDKIQNLEFTQNAIPPQSKEADLEQICNKIHESNKEETKLRNNFLTELNSISDTLNQHCRKYSKEEISQKSNNKNTQQILQAISRIEDKVKYYEDEVGKFQGKREDKSYLHIREMLIRILEKLDNIDSLKKQEIMERRKKSIILVQRLLNVLDSKVLK